MAERDNDQSVRDSIAPSQNPSQAGAPAGRGEAQQEIEVPEYKGLDAIGSKTTIDMVEDPRISGGFGWRDKLKLACNPFKPKVDGIEGVRAKKALFEFQEMYPEAAAENYALKLSVKQTGILKINDVVLHPFVRIHILDMDTNKYLAKKDRAEPGVANKESCNFFQVEGDQKEARKIPVDFFMPMSTQMYDMRVKGVNFCEWNEDFIINECAEHLLKQNVLIMFEILEFNPLLVIENSPELTPDKLYRVAWAYLRPLGTASIHLDRVKLQLYEYKFHPTQHTKYNRPLDPRTPDVLLELNWKQKQPLNTFIEVELQFCNKPMDREIERKHISRAPWEKEVGLYKYSQTKQQQARGGGLVQAEEEDMHVIKRLRKWEKFAEFPSVLPDRLAWKWESESQGAFKLKFCHSGKYLAASCTLSNNKTIIKIFDCEDGNLQIILRGHNDLVHDICWSWDDRFLVTASADGACRIWNMEDKETENSDRLNYQDNDRLFFICELYHPSFVYGAKLHPTRDEGYLYIATVCFDQKVRIWSVNVDDFENPYYKLEDERSINDAAQFTLGTKKSIYEYEENLEDETLRLIMNP